MREFARAIQAVAAAVATQEAAPGTPEWDRAFERARKDLERLNESLR